MIETDWIWGFVGGLMIGGAGALYLLVNGRIMGASGIVGGLVDRSGWPTWAERVAFIVGMVAVPPLLVPLYRAVDTRLTDNLAVVIVAGLLVGIGTRVANGCTSGHGVCGISRLSLRGIVATVFYILAGGLVMAVARHVLGVI
jgi:uncharacterized membrane protein YedE/YeeE